MHINHIHAPLVRLGPSHPRRSWHPSVSPRHLLYMEGRQALAPEDALLSLSLSLSHPSPSRPGPGSPSSATTSTGYLQYTSRSAWGGTAGAREESGVGRPTHAPSRPRWHRERKTSSPVSLVLFPSFFCIGIGISVPCLVCLSCAFDQGRNHL